MRLDILKSLFLRLSHVRTRHEDTIIKAKEDRKLAEEKIDGMIAQLNGCGDRWFLQPMKTIDECMDNNK